MRVELRLAVALGLAPRALDPALLFEPHQRGIERALIERQRMIRHLREPRRQPVGMLRSHRGQRAQDDEIEGALEELDAFTGHTSGASHGSTRLSSAAPEGAS